MSQLENRLGLYNISPGTFGTLRKASGLIHDQSAKRAEGFYKTISQSDDLKASPLSEATIASLTKSLQNHWKNLFDGKIDEAFVIESSQIGQAHEAYGITPKLYIATYNAITDALIEAIITRHRWNAGQAASIVTSLTSVMLLDIELTLTAYCDASAVKRHNASENAFADQQLDRTMDLSVAINQSAVSNARMMNVIEDVDRKAQSISAAIDQMVSGISHIAENGRAAADDHKEHR